MSGGGGLGGTGRFPRFYGEGGSWGKQGFPHGSEPKVSDSHSGSGAAPAFARHRGSRNDARPIESRYRETSGTTERMVETGSTPGSSTPTTVMAKTPTRQVLRSFAAVRMRSRTSASTKTGTSNASATPSSTNVTNR